MLHFVAVALANASDASCSYSPFADELPTQTKRDHLVKLAVVTLTNWVLFQIGERLLKYQLCDHARFQ